MAVYTCAGSQYCKWAECGEEKEELQREIKHHLLLGRTRFNEQDICLLNINVGDLESLSGDTQYCCLLAIWAARVKIMLKEMQLSSIAHENTRRRRT